MQVTLTSALLVGLITFSSYAKADRPTPICPPGPPACRSCVPFDQPNPPTIPGCPPVCPSCIDCKLVKFNCCAMQNAGHVIDLALVPCCGDLTNCNGR